MVLVSEYKYASECCIDSKCHDEHMDPLAYPSESSEDLEVDLDADDENQKWSNEIESNSRVQIVRIVQKPRDIRSYHGKYASYPESQE
jgi:hypothetical protein